MTFTKKLLAAALALMTTGGLAAQQGHYIGGGIIAICGVSALGIVAWSRMPKRPRRGGKWPG